MMLVVVIVVVISIMAVAIVVKWLGNRISANRKQCQCLLEMIFVGEVNKKQEINLPP